MSQFTSHMAHFVLDRARANVIKAHQELYRISEEMRNNRLLTVHQGFGENDTRFGEVYDAIFEMGEAAGVNFEVTPFTVSAFPGTEEEIRDNNKFFIKDSIEEVEVLAQALLKDGEGEELLNTLDIAKHEINGLIDAE